MGLDPKDALDAVKDITNNAVDNASEIAYHAGEALKGDLSGSAAGIAEAAKDIAATALAKGKDVLAPRS